jgi:hypothetical protein
MCGVAVGIEGGNSLVGFYYGSKKGNPPVHRFLESGRRHLAGMLQ